MSGYIYTHMDSFNPAAEYEQLVDFAAKNNLSIAQTIEDNDNIRKHWSERKIGKLIRSCQKNDTIVVYEASQLACSTSQVLEILSQTARYGAHVTFYKYDMTLRGDSPSVDTQMLLELIARIESDFISKRTTQALARRKAAGLPLGRPKGRGNKSLKLDKHRADIERYLELGISKASIAKLVDCHPQTLYDWLDRNNVKADRKEKEQGDKVSA